jgi:hypothetical protein
VIVANIVPDPIESKIPIELLPIIVTVFVTDATGATRRLATSRVVEDRFVPVHVPHS